MFKARSYDYMVKKIEMRNLQDKLQQAKKELIPLTYGLITKTKKDRSKRLRDRVRLVRKSATYIQKIWRRALVLWAKSDPYRDYWIQCVDEEQGDLPYYYNTSSQNTSWKVPLAYRYYHAFKHHN